MSMSLIIGSRASFLARIQTFIVKQELKKKIKNIKVSTQYASTKGDENQSATPWKDSGYGIFTGSLTNKLLNKNYDCVVFESRVIDGVYHLSNIIINGSNTSKISLSKSF